MALVGCSCRCLNNVDWWLAGVARNGCQVGAGAQHGVAVRSAYCVVRNRFPVCHVCGSCAPRGPRNFQGGFVLGRRRNRSRTWHARCFKNWFRSTSGSNFGCCNWGVFAIDGRHHSAIRFRNERKGNCRIARCRIWVSWLGCAVGCCCRLGLIGRVQRAALACVGSHT